MQREMLIPSSGEDSAYLCFIEFPRSRRGICGDQRGTDSVSAGRGDTGKTIRPNKSKSKGSGFWGRDAHKKIGFAYCFPVEMPCCPAGLPCWKARGLKLCREPRCPAPSLHPQHPVWARVGGPAATPQVLHPSTHRVGLQSYRGVQTRKAKRS